jgi:hypothetical protein
VPGNDWGDGDAMPPRFASEGNLFLSTSEKHSHSGSTSSEGSHSHIGYTAPSAAGGNPEIDNRPAYYRLAFITTGWESAYEILFHNRSDIDLFRRFRDEFLAESEKGKLYTQFLYKHSRAALDVLLDNPELMQQAAELIQMNRNAVSLVLNGEEGVIRNTDAIVVFLEAYARKSPPSLRALANIIKGEMLKHRMQDELFMGFKLN